MSRDTASFSVLCAVVLSACAGPPNATVDLGLPTRDDFPTVSRTLETHCGTLDCHGGPARSLRVYSVYGLRAAADCVPGNPDTTTLDVDSTFDSVLALDPEGLRSIMISDDVDPRTWLLLAKARGLIAHKGGAPLAAGSPGQRCILSWARGQLDQPACLNDVLGPVPRDGDTW